MNITYKEQLSKHVENIFMGYSKHGLHICDIATGGGKSYTIGKLTCQYYPEKFDRIVILCVQNKLVNSMNREIDHFINSEGSLISSSDKMVIENNPEVITQAIFQEWHRHYCQFLERHCRCTPDDVVLIYCLFHYITSFGILVRLCFRLGNHRYMDGFPVRLDQRRNYVLSQIQI